MIEILAEFVRRHDPDRFLTALFAPKEGRGALLALYAFNHELARAREAAREPALALIRLHWWREVVEGSEKRHEVATPLAAMLNAGRLDRADLLTLIDAREIEAEATVPDLAAWRAYVFGTAGGLAVAAGRALGAANPEALRPLGAAYGVAGILRNVPSLARQQRCLLPEDVLAIADLLPEAVILQPDMPQLTKVIDILIGEGFAMLEAGRVPPGAIAAALPAVLARRDLNRLAGGAKSVLSGRGIADKWAVTLAALLGRI